MQIYCFKRCKYITKTPLYHSCVLAVGKLKLGGVGSPRKVTSSCTQVPVDVESSPYSIQNGVSKYSMLKALKNQNSSHTQAEKCIRRQDPIGRISISISTATCWLLKPTSGWNACSAYWKLGHSDTTKFFRLVIAKFYQNCSPKLHQDCLPIFFQNHHKIWVSRRTFFSFFITSKSIWRNFFVSLQIWKDSSVGQGWGKNYIKIEEIVPIFDDLVNEILDTFHIYIHRNEFQAISTTINIVKSPGAVRPKTHRHYLTEKVDFL